MALSHHLDRRCVAGVIPPLVGAVADVPGRLYVNKIGAGSFAALTITANVLVSLAVDKFGWFTEIHPLNGWRMLGRRAKVCGNRTDLEIPV